MKIVFLDAKTIGEDIDLSGFDALGEVVKYIRLFGIEDKNFVIDLSIARGLDYYTGTVYETFLNGYRELGSVCSGGRYENLAQNYTDKKLPGVGISIGLLFLCFIVVDRILLHSSKKQIVLLVKGLIIAYLGLVLFLSAVDNTYMSIGYKIGNLLSNKNTFVLILIAFVIGALTVLAEPAIKILVLQVEEMTNGLIKKRSMLISLAITIKNLD